MKKILIVDDSDVIREELNSFLKGEGYEVVEAKSGSHGIEVAKEHKSFDMIITDYNMPGLNGVEMVAQLRMAGQFANLPVLMLTTESSTELRKKGQDVGIRAWLVKPINTDMLKKVLAKLLTVSAAA